MLETEFSDIDRTSLIFQLSSNSYAKFEHLDTFCSWILPLCWLDSSAWIGEVGHIINWNKTWTVKAKENLWTRCRGFRKEKWWVEKAVSKTCLFSNTLIPHCCKCFQWAGALQVKGRPREELNGGQVLDTHSFLKCFPPSLLLGICSPSYKHEVKRRKQDWQSVAVMCNCTV